MNITKIELCTRVAKRYDKSPRISINDYKNILELFLNEIFTTIAEGYRIEVRGFGCYKSITRKKRIGRNPRTGEVVDIPSYLAPYFKFSREAQKIFDEKILEVKAKAPAKKIA